MRRFKKLMAAIGVLVCMLSLTVAPVYADTDGTELQVAESSKLEIQLGSAWSGVEFQLRTDVGMYPDVIVVGEDGVLRLEIGGSSTYTLTCLNSAVTAPQVGEVDVEVVETPEDTETTDPIQDGTEEQPDAAGDEVQTPDVQENVTEDTASPDAENEEPAEESEEGTVAGIPIMHIALFGGGLLLAVGGLITIKVVSKRREMRDDYDDDYYEDDE